MGFRIPRSPVSFFWPRRDSIRTSHNQSSFSLLDKDEAPIGLIKKDSTKTSHNQSSFSLLACLSALVSRLDRISAPRFFNKAHPQSNRGSGYQDTSHNQFRIPLFDEAPFFGNAVTDSLKSSQNEKQPKGQRYPVSSSNPGTRW